MAEITFETVASTEIPKGVRRRSNTKWGPVVTALVGLPVGEALKFTAENQAEVAQIRNGVRDAVRRSEIDLGFRTSTTPAPTDENEEQCYLFIVKTAEPPSEEDEEDYSDDE